MEIYYFSDKTNITDKLNTDLREIVHVFIRSFIARKLNIKEDRIRIGRTKYGKPYIINYNIYFNISHTSAVSIVAFAEEPVGIDIENMEDEPPYAIANRFFLADEKKYIFETEDMNERRKHFYEIWTKKEAYMKYLGLGLHKPLNSFSVLHYSLEEGFASEIIDNQYMISIFIGN